MAANTSARTDAAFINARNELAAKLMAKREARSSGTGFAQAIANRVAGAGNGIGVIAGAAPAMRDNFTIARESQREIQAQRSAIYAMEQAEKVLRLRGM